MKKTFRRQILLNNNLLSQNYTTGQGCNEKRERLPSLVPAQECKQWVPRKEEWEGKEAKRKDKERRRKEQEFPQQTKIVEN